MASPLGVSPCQSGPALATLQAAGTSLWKGLRLLPCTRCLPKWNSKRVYPADGRRGHWHRRSTLNVEDLNEVVSLSGRHSWRRGPLRKHSQMSGSVVAKSRGADGSHRGSVRSGAEKFEEQVSGVAEAVAASRMNNDPFARAHVAAVQSRVVAPVVSGPRAHPPTLQPSRPSVTAATGAASARGEASHIPSLMRHFTHQHAGSIVDEPTCSSFVAIGRVTCTTPPAERVVRVRGFAIGVARPRELMTHAHHA